MSHDQQPNYVLRRAHESDMDILFRWRNDEDVRRNSFQSSVIKYEEHVLWYQKAMTREDMAIFIMMECDIPVGQVRIAFWYDEMVISYNIAKEHRGKHLGKQMLSMLEEMLKDDPECRKDGEYCVAYVKKENLVSCHVFDSLGYTREEQKKWIKYTKKLNA